MSEENPLFNPYAYINRINDLLAGETPAGERMLLSDRFRATDISDMLKTSLIAAELIATKVGSDAAVKANTRVVYAVRDAIFAEMDIADGLDLPSADRYARAALAAYHKAMKEGE